MRCSAINLGISDYDIFNPEEARYITNKEKNEKSKETKVNYHNYYNKKFKLNEKN